MWFYKKTDKAGDESGDESQELTPGVCECGHIRGCHSRGKYKCMVDTTYRIPEDVRKEHPGSTWSCACQVYIKRRDGGASNPPSVPTDPAVEELEKLMRK